MREYQTLDKLEEKVYAINDADSKESIDYAVEQFLDEVMLRKRDDPLEGGLQGSMVIMHDKAGFKIAEKNGTAVHAHTEETLAQYLDGDTMFSSFESMTKTGQKRDDPHCALVLDLYGITCRVLCGKDTLMLAFVTKNEEVTEFQLEVIEACVRLAKKYIEEGKISVAAVGYCTRQDRFLMIDKFYELDSKSSIEGLEKLETLLQTRKEEIKSK